MLQPERLDGLLRESQQLNAQPAPLGLPAGLGSCPGPCRSEQNTEDHYMKAPDAHENSRKHVANGSALSPARWGVKMTTAIHYAKNYAARHVSIGQKRTSALQAIDVRFALKIRRASPRPLRPFCAINGDPRSQGRSTRGQVQRRDVRGRCPETFKLLKLVSASTGCLR